MEDTYSEPLFWFGPSCILRIGSKFFLLLKIEGLFFEQVLVIRLTHKQAEQLIERGIHLCPVVSEVPQPRPGVIVEFICVFVVDGEAFLVFKVEDGQKLLVVVRSPLCPIL